MHINFLDIYRPRQSLIHTLDPRVKLVASLLIITTTIFLPEGAWAAQGFVFGIIIGSSLVARLGLIFTLRRAFIAVPFLLMALPILVFTPGPPLWRVPWLDWVVTTPGLIRFGTIIVRTLIAVQASVLLSATTEISDLLWGMIALGVPVLIVSIIGFMVRYLFILADEAMRMVRARAARSPRLRGAGHPGFIWQGRMAGMMVGSLFLRSLDRSERVHAAMVSRGYDGGIRVLRQRSMETRDWCVLIGVLICLTTIYVLGIWS